MVVGTMMLLLPKVLGMSVRFQRIFPSLLVFVLTLTGCQERSVRSPREVGLLYNLKTYDFLTA
jgi:hypothetical protein